MQIVFELFMTYNTLLALVKIGDSEYDYVNLNTHQSTTRQLTAEGIYRVH